MGLFWRLLAPKPLKKARQRVHLARRQTRRRRRRLLSQPLLPLRRPPGLIGTRAVVRPVIDIDHPRHRLHRVVRTSSAWCTASASYDGQYGDYDIYVSSNQPNQTVTATASNGASHTWHTDSSGYADVFLRADSGNTVAVTAGAATRSTTA